MILQRLSAYYDRVSLDPKTPDALPKPGYSVQKISFCVVLHPDGKFQFQSMLDEGATKPVPRQMLVPGQSKPTGQGINPCFLWDNAAYMLAFKLDDASPDRTRKSFEAFRKLHLDAADAVDAASFNAVCSFLQAWSPDKSREHATELASLATHFGVFKIAGAHGYVHDDPKVIEFCASSSTADGSAASASQGFCLVTGERGPIARLHEPKIKGVGGAQSSGALLVSFNEAAYESFGKEQGNNAPVGTAAAFKYTNALNYLLARRDRRISLGDSTVVFWADSPTMLEDLADEIFSDAPPPKPDAPPEDKQRAEQVRNFLTQLRDGHSNAAALDQNSDVGFYVLGLSPNASRISVRFWVHSTVGEMERRLRQHLLDTNLGGARGDDPPIVIRRIVQAAGRAEFMSGSFKGYNADAVPPILSGAIARAVLEGTPYPSMLLGAMINRLRADRYVSHVRVAAIKGCIVRNSRFSNEPKEIPVSLDETRSEPAYATGRLFALLEKIQADSVEGTLNSTIKDRYFSSASATPASVFPRLIRLSQHHLAKMEPGRKVYYERLIAGVVGKLDNFASHLNLQDQGLFAIGYFHQRQDLFTSKKEKEGQQQ